MGQGQCNPRHDAGRLEELRVNAGKLDAFQVLSNVSVYAKCPAHCSDPDLARQCGLGFCRAESSDATAAPCNCVGLREPCCCSQCEDAFGQPRPLPGAQSASQAGQPTLVLRPGHDSYNSLDRAAFHTVVRPPDGECIGDNPSPTGTASFVPQAPQSSPLDSARTCASMNSESSFEDCNFKTRVPVVITRRPESVPRLNIAGKGAPSGGVAIGTGVSASVSAMFRWPKIALNAAPSGSASTDAEVASSCSQLAHSIWKKKINAAASANVVAVGVCPPPSTLALNPARVSQPAEPAVSPGPANPDAVRIEDVESQWFPREGLDFHGSGAVPRTPPNESCRAVSHGDAAAAQPVKFDAELQQLLLGLQARDTSERCAHTPLARERCEAPTGSTLHRECSGLDMEALERVKNYLALRPDLSDELLNIDRMAQDAAIELPHLPSTPMEREDSAISTGTVDVPQQSCEADVVVERQDSTMTNGTVDLPQQSCKNLAAVSRPSNASRRSSRGGA